MRKRVGAIIAGLALLGAALPDPGARFDWVEYRGVDGAPAPAGQFRNPVLAGFYPDPSVLRVGDDFYLVNSTFAWFPGIPVLHSRDLVHWRQIGNAIDRAGQLDYRRIAMSRGVFAPDISYHAGRFYIVTTCVDCGGNFVVTARDPAGPWSDPVLLPSVEGIDPSLFFDDDGKAWIVNNRAPVGTPRYDGHRALWIEGFDPIALKMLGNPTLLVDGGVAPAKRPVWIEGPHIFRHDGHYYLTAAEGGTATEHSQVIFRADAVTGPYRPAPAGVNPILTQRDLDPARPAPITSAGHADLVRLANGDWWATFLATRPYRGDLYNTGRETFLLPVTWRDGWPTILAAGRAIPTLLAAPRLPQGRAAPTTGSFTVRDDFTAPTLSPAWMTMRVPPAGWGRVDRGALVLQASGDAIGDHGHPSFVARRQAHATATVTTALAFTPTDATEAGLAAVQDDDHFLGIALTGEGGRPAIRAFRRDGAGEPATGRTLALVPVAAGAVRLRIVARGAAYDLDFAHPHGDWRHAARDVDATILSTARAGGFTGTMIGPFAARR